MRGLAMLASGCLILAGAACGSDSDPTARMIGAWNDCASGSNNLILGEGGSFELTAPGDHIVGTFTITGNLLAAHGAADDGSTVDYSFTFYMSEDDRLVPVAAFPDGNHDGVVGTWRDTLSIASSTGEIQGGDREIQFLADGTGMLTVHPANGDPDSVGAGTWAEDPIGTFALTIPTGSDTAIVFDFTLVDDAVLGTPFCRVAP